ncbi:hypothetical protein NDU88_001203, partial [Pleurodeles waltl]
MWDKVAPGRPERTGLTVSCFKIPMPVGFLEDAGYCDKVVVAVKDYLDLNWSTTDSRGTEWEALKAVVRGVCIGTTCGVRKQMEQELTEQEDKLDDLQCQTPLTRETEREQLRLYKMVNN